MCLKREHCLVAQELVVVKRLTAGDVARMARSVRSHRAFEHGRSLVTKGVDQQRHDAAQGLLGHHSLVRERQELETEVGTAGWYVVGVVRTEKVHLSYEHQETGIQSMEQGSMETASVDTDVYSGVRIFGCCRFGRHSHFQTSCHRPCFDSSWTQFETKTILIQTQNREPY